MMYGSIFYNCWAALLGFTVYFSVAIQDSYALPVNVLVGSFVTALVVFLCTFPVRLLLGYVLFTPQEVELQEATKVEGQQSITEESPLSLKDQSSTVKIEDENTEEIAKAVRTMMYTDEQSVPGH